MSENGHLIQSEQDLGTILKRRRKEVGVTQKQLADFCNLSHNGISQIEMAEKSPRLSTLLKLGKILGLKIAVYEEENHAVKVLDMKKRAEKERNKFDKYLRRTYKITLDDYNKMLAVQNNACALCKQPQPNLKYKLVVDHNHDTGKVRGLLCHLCNTHRVRNHSLATVAATYEYLRKTDV